MALPHVVMVGLQCVIVEIPDHLLFKICYIQAIIMDVLIWYHALVCEQNTVLLICSNALGHNFVVLYLKVFDNVTYIIKLETI